METTRVIETRNSVATAWWTAVDADLLSRVRKTSLVLGVVVGIPLTTYYGLMAGAAWVAGIVWSLVNLGMMGALIKRVLADERDKSAIVLALAIKFPVLYAAGLVLLAVLHLPAAWLVAGFTWPLFVAVMKAGGRAYLGLDDTRASNRQGLES
jgi:hypothetical protein